MNVVVSLCQRFSRAPDGSVWTPGQFARSFWDRYLAVFDGVRIVARVLDVAERPAGWLRADGDGVAVTAIPYYRGPWQYLLQSRRVVRAVRAAVTPADAVILRVPSQIAGCLVPALRRSGQPYAVEVVGDPYEVYAPGAVRHPLRPFLRRYFPAQLRRHCAGAAAAAYVSRHILPERYPCPAHSAFFSDVELPEEAFAATPRSADSSQRSFTLITVGSLEQMYKGVDVLLDALAACVRKGWDLKLVVVGEGKHRPELEKQAAALGLEHRVSFRGQLAAGAAVRAQLDGADLFVLPSRTEGLPRALIEAQARGLPCLGSSVGGIPELLLPEDMVPAGDSTRLADKIAEVLADPLRRAAMAARGLARAAEYRPALLRQRMLDFYCHVRDVTRAWQEASLSPFPLMGEAPLSPSPLMGEGWGGGERLTPRPNPPPQGGREQERRPTVLHVTTVPQSLAFLRGQVAHLKGQGFEVHALSSPGGALDRFGVEQQVAVHAVPMRRQISPLRDVVSLWRLGRVLRRVRPDVVHAHTPKGGLLAMLAAWLVRSPLRIYHIHGLPLMTARGPRRFLLRWSENMACALAHHVLCVSSSVRLVAVAEGLCRPEKIEVLLHGSIDGVDAEKRFNPAGLEPSVRSAIRSQHGIPQDAVVIGFVGRIVRDKGIVELARAWQALAAEVPTLHLLLVGNAEPQDPLPEEVERLLRSSPRIHWAGVVHEMAPLYLAMDVVALPSYREGFGVVCLEAAAMELPVVATRIPGCVDAVRHEETGALVPPYDAPALAEAVRAYVQDSQLRRRHGQAGRRRALRDFQPAAMSQAVAELYTRLLGAPAPSFYQRRGKRWLDVVLASLALLVLWPVLLGAALLVWLTLGAPVFFRQRRSGRHGRPFTILKLRTMRDEWGSSGRRAPDKQRLTRLGRFLRATSIDELPELFNILKGDMSLVGPRPLMPRYLPWYSAQERRRFDCLPGLTGWAQINGRNALGWDQRLALDAWYVRACSLGLDLEILVRTVFKVLRRENVHVDSSRVLRSLDEERREALGQPASLQRSEQTERPDGCASPLLGFSKEG